MAMIWLKDPKDSNFPAALDYLELVFEPKKAKKIVNKLLAASTISKKAKDISGPESCLFYLKITDM